MVYYSSIQSPNCDIKLHFVPFYFNLYIRIRDSCEDVQLNATIQLSGVFSIKFVIAITFWLHPYDLRLEDYGRMV